VRLLGEVVHLVKAMGPHAASGRAEAVGTSSTPPLLRQELPHRPPHKQRIERACRALAPAPALHAIIDRE